MKQHPVSLTLFAIIAATALMSHTAHAVTMRYALIVGNNDGTDRDGSRPFTPLRHAEREVVILRDALVARSNFDPSGARTIVLTGATRSDVKIAIKRLVKQQRTDSEMFGKMNTLFLFYFTGHGLDGRLLLQDGPLAAEEIGHMFSQMNADFSIGVFDACFSGSLDATRLAAKGILAAPGLNLFRELPEEVLSAEGRVWFVSSGSNQESFEDEQLGGVFTHFFTEALERADVSGPGITLENIWQYARSHTVEFTARRNRFQAPEKYIANLRTGAPVYFSFPMPRSATLRLSKGLSGKFALAYNSGNLTEVFEKKEGEERAFAVYPGQARLILVNPDNEVSSRNIHLKPGEKLILRNMSDVPFNPHLGERAQTLMEKGGAEDWHITVSHVKTGISILSGLGYEFRVSHPHFLFARHGLVAPLRIDIGHLFLSSGFFYGHDKRIFQAWSHTVDETGGRIAVGYAFTRSRLRLGTGAAFQGTHLKQVYDNDAHRTANRFGPLIEMTLLYRFRRRVYLSAFADIGAAYGPGVGADSENLWQFITSIGCAVNFRLL